MALAEHYQRGDDRPHAIRWWAKAAAHALIAGELPGRLGTDPEPKLLEALREGLMAQPQPAEPRLGRDDYLGALGVFLLVVGSTIPVVVPFALLDTLPLAMRTSNGIALVMLFAIAAIICYSTPAA